METYAWKNIITTLTSWKGNTESRSSKSIIDWRPLTAITS